jgi:uncharacterized protein
MTKSPPAGTQSRWVRNLARRHPVGTFVAVVLAIAWPAFGIPIAGGWPTDPSKLGVTLVVMLGAATAISAWTGGPPAVRRLFSGVTRWRIGIGRYLLVLGAMPALTVTVAAITGTLHAPDGGLLRLIGTYLFLTVVFGALILNLWEETAWSGLVQMRLMARHGLLVGSLLTAIPFVAIHLPLAFEGNISVASVGLSLGALAGTAVFLRYLIGTILVDTGGSVLAVGLLHASFNASGSLSVLDGDAWWLTIVALVVLTLVVAAYRAARGRSAVNAYGEVERTAPPLNRRQSVGAGLDSPASGWSALR